MRSFASKFIFMTNKRISSQTRPAFPPCAKGYLERPDCNVECESNYYVAFKHSSGDPHQNSQIISLYNGSCFRVNQEEPKEWFPEKLDGFIILPLSLRIYASNHYRFICLSQKSDCLLFYSLIIFLDRLCVPSSR